MNAVAEAFWQQENQFYLISGEGLPDEIVIGFHNKTCACDETKLRLEVDEHGHGSLKERGVQISEFGDYYREFDSIDMDRVAHILKEWNGVGLWDLETRGYTTISRKFEVGEWE